MPSQHPNDQLQKKRNIKTKIIKDNKEGTCLIIIVIIIIIIIIILYGV